jgi:hypothetical protein
VNTADDIKKLALDVEHAVCDQTRPMGALGAKRAALHTAIDALAGERDALLEALRELTTLDGIRIKYSTSRPDSPRHPLWEQYLQDVAGFHERLEHAWHFARAAIKKCEEPK